MRAWTRSSVASLSSSSDRDRAIALAFGHPRQHRPLALGEIVDGAAGAPALQDLRDDLRIER